MYVTFDASQVWPSTIPVILQDDVLLTFPGLHLEWLSNKGRVSPLYPGGLAERLYSTQIWISPQGFDFLKLFDFPQITVQKVMRKVDILHSTIRFFDQSDEKSHPLKRVMVWDFTLSVRITYSTLHYFSSDWFWRESEWLPHKMIEVDSCS